MTATSVSSGSSIGDLRSKNTKSTCPTLSMPFAVCLTNEVTRPNVLVLASDALFQHFFSEDSLAKLGEVTSWTRSTSREDGPELRSQIANAEVLMTTWHSPFLTREMLGQQPRVKLIAHCGGEVKSVSYT